MQCNRREVSTHTLHNDAREGVVIVDARLEERQRGHRCCRLGLVCEEARGDGLGAQRRQRRQRRIERCVAERSCRLDQRRLAPEGRTPARVADGGRSDDEPVEVSERLALVGGEPPAAHATRAARRLQACTGSVGVKGGGGVECRSEPVGDMGVLACWRVGVLVWWHSRGGVAVRGGVVAWWRGGDCRPAESGIGSTLLTIVPSVVCAIGGASAAPSPPRSSASHRLLIPLPSGARYRLGALAASSASKRPSAVSTPNAELFSTPPPQRCSALVSTSRSHSAVNAGVCAANDGTPWSTRSPGFSRVMRVAARPPVPRPISKRWTEAAVDLAASPCAREHAPMPPPMTAIRGIVSRRLVSEEIGSFSKGGQTTNDGDRLVPRV